MEQIVDVMGEWLVKFRGWAYEVTNTTTGEHFFLFTDRAYDRKVRRAIRNKLKRYKVRVNGGKH